MAAVSHPSPSCPPWRTLRCRQRRRRMTIDDHLIELYGLPVQDYVPGQGLRDAGEVAWRLRTEPAGHSFEDRLLPFLAEPDVDRVQALVIGCWTDDPVHEDSDVVVQALAAASVRLSSLRAVFLGD